MVGVHRYSLRIKFVLVSYYSLHINRSVSNKIQIYTDLHRLGGPL